MLPRILGRALALTLLLPALSGGHAQAPLVRGAWLKPTVGGLLLETTLSARTRGEDTLLGVWAAGSKVNLLKCAPRCQVVKSVPVTGEMVFGPKTMYRIVLGGRFQPGQKVGLMLSFRSGLAPVEAVVSRD